MTLWWHIQQSMHVFNIWYTVYVYQQMYKAGVLTHWWKKQRQNCHVAWGSTCLGSTTFQCSNRRPQILRNYCKSPVVETFKTVIVGANSIATLLPPVLATSSTDLRRVIGFGQSIAQKTRLDEYFSTLSSKICQTARKGLKKQKDPQKSLPQSWCRGLSGQLGLDPP